MHLNVVEGKLFGIFPALNTRLLGILPIGVLGPPESPGISK